MSTAPKYNSEDQEIDLAQIAKRIGRGYQNLLTAIFDGILFIKKNGIIIGFLFVLGLGLGIYLDKTTPAYENEVIVTPNFGTTDYLYSNINLINSRIADGDTTFLKSIGIKYPKRISKIEIKPIIDIYNFVNKNSGKEAYRNSQNYELVKLLSESGDINKVIADDVTSRNYPDHVLKIYTTKKIQYKDVVEPLLKFLNSNAFHENIRKEFVQNIRIKIQKNEEMINQINEILDEFSSQNPNNQKSDKLVYYNENSQLNDIITTKNNLLLEIGTEKIDLITYDKVIKEKSKVINIREKKGVNNKMKFLLPMFLIFCFILIRVFRSFYRKQELKRNASVA